MMKQACRNVVHCILCYPHTCCDVFKLMILNTLLKISSYTFLHLKGKTSNGGRSGWSLAGKEFFEADSKRHSTAAQACGGMTFYKDLHRCYQQRRNSRRGKSPLCGSSQDKQSNKKLPAYPRFDYRSLMTNQMRTKSNKTVLSSTWKTLQHMAKGHVGLMADKLLLLQWKLYLIYMSHMCILLSYGHMELMILLQTAFQCLMYAFLILQCILMSIWLIYCTLLSSEW